MKNRVSPLISRLNINNSNGYILLPLAVPGLVLLLLGFAVVFFPRVVLILISTLLIWLGLIVLYLAYKFYTLKSSLDKAAKEALRNFKTSASSGMRAAVFKSESNYSDLQGIKKIFIDQSSIEVLDAEDEFDGREDKKNKDKIILH